MKKKLTILFVSLSAVLILDTFNAGQALVMLLLAGVIPGTNVVIAADSMLKCILLVSGFVCSRITVYAAHAYATVYRDTTQPSNGTILSAQS